TSTNSASDRSSCSRRRQGLSPTGASPCTSRRRPAPSSTDMPPTDSNTGSEVRVLVPTGMLGAGFPPETIDRGLNLGAHVIAVDGGSTDSGAYYLGTATAKSAEKAVAQDLRVLL